MNSASCCFPRGKTTPFSPNRGDLKGSLLKGSFDKACALTCWFLWPVPTPPPPSTPSSRFPLFSTGNRPPPPLEPDPKPLPQGHQYKLAPFAKKKPGKIWSAKTDPVRFKQGFGEGLLKDKFAFVDASKNPIPKRIGGNCLQNAHFYKQKVPCLKTL